MARPRKDIVLSTAERAKRCRANKKARLLLPPQDIIQSIVIIPEPQTKSAQLAEKVLTAQESMAHARVVVESAKREQKQTYSAMFEEYMLTEIEILDKATEQIERKSRFLAILEAQTNMAIIGGQNTAAQNLLDRLMGKVTDSLKLSGDNQNPVAIQSIQMLLVAPNESIVEPMAEVATTEPLDMPETVFEEVVEEPEPGVSYVTMGLMGL